MGSILSGRSRYLQTFQPIEQTNVFCLELFDVGVLVLQEDSFLKTELV